MVSLKGEETAEPEDLDLTQVSETGHNIVSSSHRAILQLSEACSQSLQPAVPRIRKPHNKDGDFKESKARNSLQAGLNQFADSHNQRYLVNNYSNSNQIYNATNGHSAQLNATCAYPAGNEAVAEATHWEESIEDVLGDRSEHIASQNLPNGKRDLKQSESFLSGLTSSPSDNRKNTEVVEENRKQNTSFERSKTPESSQDIIDATPLEANSLRKRKRFKKSKIKFQTCSNEKIGDGSDSEILDMNAISLPTKRLKKHRKYSINNASDASAVCLGNLDHSEASIKTSPQTEKQNSARSAEHINHLEHPVESEVSPKERPKHVQNNGSLSKENSWCADSLDKSDISFKETSKKRVKNNGSFPKENASHPDNPVESEILPKESPKKRVKNNGSFLEENADNPVESDISLKQSPKKHTKHNGSLSNNLDDSEILMKKSAKKWKENNVSALKDTNSDEHDGNLNNASLSTTNVTNSEIADQIKILLRKHSNKHKKHNSRKKRILTETKATDEEEIGENTGRSEADSEVETSILNSSRGSLDNSESNCEGKNRKSKHQKPAKRKRKSEADDENGQASKSIPVNSQRKKRILTETKTTDEEEIGENTGRSEAVMQTMDLCESEVEISILNSSSGSLNNSESNCDGENHKSKHLKPAKRKRKSEADEKNDQASKSIRKKGKKVSTIEKRRLSSNDEQNKASNDSYEDADPNDSDGALEFFLRLRKFNRDFQVPRLHQIVDRASNPTEIQREQIAEEGIEVKTCRFSSAEDQQIHENWQHFIHVFGLQDQPQKFFCLQTKRVTVEAKRNFLFYLARGFNNRTLYSVFKRFKMLMDRVTKGRFSQEEDEFILKAMEEKPRMPVTEVARHLHRSLLAVSCRMNKLKNTYSRKIKWSGRNAASYIKYLLIATDIDEKDIGLLKDRQITTEEWSKLSETLDNVPVRILKPVWLNFLHPALFIPGSSCDLGEIKWKLAKNLSKNNETEWSSVDWTKYVARFEGFTSLKLYTLFKQLVKTHVPEKKQANLARSLKHLMKIKLNITAQPLKILYKIKYRHGEIQDMRLDRE